MDRTSACRTKTCGVVLPEAKRSARDAALSIASPWGEDAEDRTPTRSRQKWTGRSCCGRCNSCSARHTTIHTLPCSHFVSKGFADVKPLLVNLLVVRSILPEKGVYVGDVILAAQMIETVPTPCYPSKRHTQSWAKRPSLPPRKTHTKRSAPRNSDSHNRPELT